MCEYVGEVAFPTPIPQEKSDYSMSVKEQGVTQCVIDSKHKGNISRFFNHSCSSCGNLKPEIVRVNHIFPRVAFVTTRDVKDGEELTFDYGTSFGSLSHCECGCCI